MYRLLKISAAAMAVAAFAQSADAQPASTSNVVVKQVVVSYADLNLNNEAGTDALLDRIEHAADRACGGNPQFDANYQIAREFLTREYEQCRAAAVSGAVAGVSESLTHVAYNAR